MRHGHNEEFLVAMDKANQGKKGWSTPPVLLAKPVLNQQDTYYYRAFHALDLSRAVSESIGYIPLSEIVAYCQLKKISDCEFFFDVIQNIDRAYVRFIRARHSEELERYSQSKAKS